MNYKDKSHYEGANFNPDFQNVYFLYKQKLFIKK